MNMRAIYRRSQASRFSAARRRGGGISGDQRAYRRREDRLNILIDLPVIDGYRRPMYAQDPGSHRRRTERGIRQRQQARARTFPLFSREGVNGVVFLALVILLGGFMVWMLGQSLSGLNAAGGRVNSLTSSVETLKQDIDTMAEACETKAASLNIPVEAAKLGMISADYATTVILHVREDAVVPLMVETGYERTETLAAIIGR